MISQETELAGVYDDSSDAEIIDVAGYKFKVAKNAENASPDDYNLGRRKGLKKQYCVFCGEKIKDKKKETWGSASVICREDYENRVLPEEKAKKKSFTQGYLTFSQFMGATENAPEGPITPKCCYCGEEMKILRPFASSMYIHFIWVCPHKHSALVTRSSGGIS